MPTVLMLTRRILLSTWFVLVAIVLALVITTQVAGPLGYRLVIVRGASMSPAIPLGALAFEQPVAAADIAPGDVVTLALAQGVLVTHRVIRVASVDGRPYVETRGDANADADPTLQPASAATGVVRFSVPIAGFLRAYVGTEWGILSVLSLLGSLLASIWLLEMVDGDRRASATGTASAPTPDMDDPLVAA